MIVSIQQPAYLPWLGHFDRIARSDVHIALDHVQFQKNSFINRNKIRTVQGWTWLSVPVKTKNRFGNLPICEIETAETRSWRRKHWDSIRFNYAKAPFFAEHAPFFNGVYGRDWPRLSGLIRATTDYLLGALGIGTRILYSSEMTAEGNKEALVLNLCREVGANTYLSGPFGRDYLDPQGFKDAGIRLLFHDYQHPEYQQVFPGFEPHMSVVDLLFNAGPKSKVILNRGESLSET